MSSENQLTIEFFNRHAVPVGDESKYAGIISNRTLYALRADLENQDPGAYAKIESSSLRFVSYRLYYFVDEDRNVRLAAIPC